MCVNCETQKTAHFNKAAWCEYVLNKGNIGKGLGPHFEIGFGSQATLECLDNAILLLLLVLDAYMLEE